MRDVTFGPGPGRLKYETRCYSDFDEASTFIGGQRRGLTGNGRKGLTAIRGAPPNPKTLGTQLDRDTHPAVDAATRTPAERLIDAIVSLEDGAPIPESVLLEHPTNQIAESIVERLVRQSDATSAGFLSKAEVQLFFPEVVLDDLLESGEFLNIHQCDESHPRAQELPTDADVSERLATFREARVWTESTLTGLDLSIPSDPKAQKKLDELRPKSAFLVPQNQSEHLASMGFGEIIAIPKAEVRRRMTWTPMDSYATPEELERGGTFFCGPESPPPDAFRYLEAQIWGRLTLDDMAEFWVAPNAKPETVAKLKALGKPLYGYDVKSVKIGPSFDFPIRAFRSTRIA